MAFYGRLHYWCNGVLLILLWSCRSNASDTLASDVERNSLHDLLSSSTFYNDTANYHRLFFRLYNQAIKAEKFEDAKGVLLHFGEVSHDVYDTMYVATATHFIDEKFPVATDSSYAMICHFLSWSYSVDYNYEPVLYWAKKALASCTFPNADRTKAHAYSDLGNAYADMGKMDIAINYLLTANAIFSKTGDKPSLAANYLDIGVCYFKLLAVDECIQYIHRSGELYLELKDTSNFLNNRSLISIYGNELSMDTTTLLKYIDESEKWYRLFLHKERKDIFFHNMLLAKKNILKGQYAEAETYLEICGNDSDIRLNSVMDGLWDMLTMDYELATLGHINDEEDVIATTKEMVEAGDFSNAALAYKFLAQNAVGKKNFEEAFHYKTLEQKQKDTIQKINIKSQLFKLDKKYQSEKKEQQIALQQKVILSRNITIALLGTSILGIVLAAVALQYRQRQKKLTQEKQNTLNYTRQLLEKTEEERKRIASDLHDSISHELLSLKTAVRAEDATAVNEKVDTIINDIRIISRNLHPVMFDKIGLQLSIEQMVERIQQQNNFMLTADIDYQAGSLPSSAELQVYRIVQEAVTNIIKYSAAIAGKISIQQTAATVEIEVKDNGKGFHVEETLNSGKAFGLYNIVERSRAIGGEAKIESGAGGTIITIRIPKP